MSGVALLEVLAALVLVWARLVLICEFRIGSLVARGVFLAFLCRVNVLNPESWMVICSVLGLGGYAS